MRTVKHLLDSKGRRIVTIAPEAPVLEAIQMMADEHIGALLVMREDAIAGICSERDYARKVILRGRSSGETEVWEIMSSPVLSVGPDDTINGCMRLMTNHHIRHLPVIEDGVATGMLSIGDLVKAVIEDQQQEIDQLKQYVQG